MHSHWPAQFAGTATIFLFVQQRRAIPQQFSVFPQQIVRHRCKKLSEIFTQPILRALLFSC
jgi:hypothetical protein